MKKLLIPAMGVAAAFGAAQPAAADVQLAQLMIQGQPGYTGNVNRTAPSGSPGIAPMNTPVGPSPYTVAPSPSFARPAPFIGQRGDLNTAERESAMPGEPDASGRIGPTVDRTRARFAGERGADGKLLPTYAPQEAQAPSQTTPQAAPPTPSRSDMPSTQPSTTPRGPGSGATSTPAPQGQSQMGTTGATPMRSGSSSSMGSGATSGDKSMQGTQHRRSAQSQMKSDRQRSGSTQARTGTRSQNEMSETAALNALSAEGYTNVGKIERVGGNWQTTAMKDGKQVTVQVNPQTNQVTSR